MKNAAAVLVSRLSLGKNEKIEKLVYEAKRYSLKREITKFLATDISDEKKTKHIFQSCALIDYDLPCAEY